MFDWLKSIFRSEDTVEMSRREQPRESVALPKSTPSASAAKPLATAPQSTVRRFRSAAVTDLYSQIADISHPEYPFLDRSYSPGSYMPAADFSPWLASRQRQQDRVAIEELLNYLAYSSHAQAVLKTISALDLRRFIRGSDALMDELWAVTFLGYRYIETGQASNRTALLRELYTHTLACWPFEFVEDAVPYLLEGANKFIRKQNRALKDVRAPEPEIDSIYLTGLSVPAVSRFGEDLQRYPVTFRAMIRYSLERGSPVLGCIRPQLGGHYGLRQFGLSADLNLRFLGSCSCFQAPEDLRALALRLKKEVLLEIGALTGIALRKSAKKDDLVALLMADEKARQLVGQQGMGEFVQVVPEFRPSFDAWQGRVLALDKIALCLACI